MFLKYETEFNQTDFFKSFYNQNYSKKLKTIFDLVNFELIFINISDNSVILLTNTVIQLFFFTFARVKEF
jgi:hypothetical protein